MSDFIVRPLSPAELALKQGFKDVPLSADTRRRIAAGFDRYFVVDHDPIEFWGCGAREVEPISVEFTEPRR